jgi:DeoR family transcriptional regulator of aga operon
MNSLLASRARRVVVIADASKLGKHAFARVCSIEGVHTLVTDVSVPDADIEPFQAAGVEVLRV